MKITKKEVAECVGLWLAEGDNKTTKEVTFTNNCLELVLFFHENIKKLYTGKNNSRLYIYSSTPRVLVSNLNGLVIRNYIDNRANKTYYIFRLSDVKFVRKWKELVKNLKNNKNFYSDILRGIFAGEGNVKHQFKNRNSRNLRIASGKRDAFVEKLLKFFDIPIKFDQNKRAYWIHGRSLDNLNDINIASLHPEKEAKFRKMINSVKEKHYSPGEFKLLLLKNSHQFQKTKNLAQRLRRSEVRTLEALRELKQENKITNIKTKYGSFWARKDLIENYINEEKLKILHNLNKYQSLRKTGRAIGMSRKSIALRMLRYQQEGLVVYNENKRSWEMTNKGKVIVGVDESGSEF